MSEGYRSHSLGCGLKPREFVPIPVKRVHLQRGLVTVTHLCAGIICLHLYPLSLPLSLICTGRIRWLCGRTTQAHPFSCTGLAQGCCLCSKGSSSSQGASPQQCPGSAAQHSPRQHSSGSARQALLSVIHSPSYFSLLFWGCFFQRERKQAGFALQLSFKVKINAAWEKANVLDVEVLVIHGKNSGLDCSLSILFQGQHKIYKIQ